MKYAKTLGRLAVAVAALMAFPGNASATLTSPAGTALNAGAQIKAKDEGGGAVLDGTIKLWCTKSTVAGTVSKNGGTSGAVSSLTFTECGSNTVSVVKGGELSISSSGTVTSSGAEITALTHNLLGTVHCIFVTSNTDVGTLTESGFLFGATLDVGSRPIPVTPTDSACKDDAVWTGDYEITTPSELYFD